MNDDYAEFDPFAMQDNIAWDLGYYYDTATTSGRGGQQEDAEFNIEDFYEFLPDGFDGWNDNIDPYNYYDYGYYGVDSYGYGDDYYDYGYGYYGAWYYGYYYPEDCYYYDAWYAECCNEDWYCWPMWNYYSYYDYYGDYYWYDNEYGTFDDMEKPDLYAAIANGADEILEQFDELNSIMESGMYDLMTKSEQNELI
jgi:hypothetical protein